MFASPAATLILAAGLASGVTTAHAATVHDIEGDWQAGTSLPPATVAKGNVVTANWYVNVNDDNEAPTNEPVDNMNFTVTVANGLIKVLPTVCLTGAGVSPESDISDDGRTLTCNLGTVQQGTAYVVPTPIVVDGRTGDEVTATGSISGADPVDLEPLLIQNTFGMDIHWGTPTGAYTYAPDSSGAGPDLVFDFEWTLFQDAGSDPGPQTVSYDLLVTLANGQPLDVGSFTPGGPPCVPFTPFTAGAQGHPWSGTSIPDRTAPFVESCVLEETATAGVFRLTLSGIDYSQVLSPRFDSTGAPLPLNQVAVASGTIWLRVDALAATTSANLQVINPPLYTPDVPGGVAEPETNLANNTSNKAIPFPGTWSHAFDRDTGGTTWDDTRRVAPGGTIRSGTADYVAVDPGGAPDAAIGECDVLDSAYVDFSSVTVSAWTTGTAGVDVTGLGTLEYYVGNDPTVTEGNGGYDPNAFTGCSGTTDWVTTEPVDKSTIKAVRWTTTFGTLGSRLLAMNVWQVVEPDVAVGQDVWTFGSGIRNGVWENYARHLDGTFQITPTAGRYPYTTFARDVFRVVGTLPYVQKAANPQVLDPGGESTFTLSFSAIGGSATIDGYTIIDALPEDMTYVPGSTAGAPTTPAGSPAWPEPVVDMVGNQQRLTWTFDGLTKDITHFLTYRAVADDTASAGEVLTNTAWSSAAGQTSPPASSSVTVTENGSTVILKTADSTYIPNPDGSGDGFGSWTIAIQSFDSQPQAFTDTIDILPHLGDGRVDAGAPAGTDYSGSYMLDQVLAPGATVYYTDADPTTPGLEDPADAANGAAGAPNLTRWSTTRPVNVTAVRVVGGQLAPGATFEFEVRILTDGAIGGDAYVNLATARAEHTVLPMRTSDPIIVANYYAATLLKEVQDLDGVWHDAEAPVDYPAFEVGDTIPYRITITNTGQGTLTNLVITDDIFDQGSFNVASLAPGAFQTHEFSVVSDTSMIGTTVNTVSATAGPPPDAPPPAIPPNQGGVTVASTLFDKVLVDKTPNGDGTYTIVYDIVVTRDGPGPAYDLIDTLRFGASASIVSTDVENTDPGLIVTNDAWNGTSDTTVATGVPIGDDESHTYRVTVLAGIDEPSTTAAMSDCVLGPGETGTGFVNTAQLTTGLHVFDDDGCPEYPAPVITKAMVGDPAPLGGGVYRATYAVTVTNNGVDPTSYDLDDTLRYGAGVGIVGQTVINTVPGGVVTSGTWNGTSDTRVATTVPLAGSAVHTYTVTVEFMVDAATTAEAADCTLGGGENGTGLLNTATLAHNGENRTADACGTPPLISIDKEITSGPTSSGNGQQQVTYRITVSNTGGPGAYDLTDRLTYGGNISIVSATVANATPGGIVTNTGWNGVGNTDVVTGQAIAAGATHTYTVTVTVTAGAIITSAQGDCTLATGENGTGLLNTAHVDNNGVTAEDNACAEVLANVPPPTTPPVTTPNPGELPSTGGSSQKMLQLAAVVILAGTAILIVTRRRRTA